MWFFYSFFFFFFFLHIDKVIFILNTPIIKIFMNPTRIFFINFFFYSLVSKRFSCWTFIHRKIETGNYSIATMSFSFYTATMAYNICWFWLLLLRVSLISAFSFHIFARGLLLQSYCSLILMNCIGFSKRLIFIWYELFQRIGD